MLRELRPHVMADLRRDARAHGSERCDWKPTHLTDVRREPGRQPAQDQASDQTGGLEPAWRRRQFVDDKLTGSRGQQDSSGPGPAEKGGEGTIRPRHDTRDAELAAK